MPLPGKWTPERRTRATWGVAAPTIASALVLAVSGLCSVAAPAEVPPTAANDAAKTASRVGEPRSESAKVVEAGTGKPVAGAKVTVRRFARPDPQPGWGRILRVTEHRTDAEGRYDFTIAREEMAEPRLGIIILVEHPDHPPETDFYHDLHNAFRNAALGDPFSFDSELSPGEPITGVVETPDGKPAAGVVVHSFSFHAPDAKPGYLVMGFSDEARTDDQGRFRFVVPTPGEVDLQVIPERYAVSVREIKDNTRGDLGRFVLREGLPLSGRVIDADGKSLAGVAVSVAGFPREPGEDPMYDDSHWKDSQTSFTRWAVTDAAGGFATGPMPPGVYVAVPVELDRDPVMGETFRRLPAPFIPARVTLKEGEAPKPLELRALPSVAVEVQVRDSRGRPLSYPSFALTGSLSKVKPRRFSDPPRLEDDVFWLGSGCPDVGGKIVFHAPRDLQGASVMDFTRDEHRAMRHRIGKDAPLRNDNQMTIVAEPHSVLGFLEMRSKTLDHDVKDIEIISYESPTVLVKVASPDGSKPKGARVWAAYAGSKVPDEGPDLLDDGPRFAEQKDGRFRSQRLLPDETVTLTAKADGFAPRVETLRLPEGAVKELEMVLEKK